MEVVATAPDNDGDWGRAAAAIDDGWAGRDDVTDAGGAQRDRATGAAAPNPDEGAFWATALGDGRGGATARTRRATRPPRGASRPAGLRCADRRSRAIRRDRAAGPCPRVAAAYRDRATAAAGAESPPAAAPRRRPPAPNTTGRRARAARRSHGAATGCTAARSSGNAAPPSAAGWSRPSGRGASGRCARARTTRCRAAARAPPPPPPPPPPPTKAEAGAARVAPPPPPAARALDGDAARWLRGMLHPTKNAVLDLGARIASSSASAGPTTRSRRRGRCSRAASPRRVPAAARACRSRTVSRRAPRRRHGVARGDRERAERAAARRPRLVDGAVCACGAGLSHPDYRAEVRAAASAGGVPRVRAADGAAGAPAADVPSPDVDAGGAAPVAAPRRSSRGDRFDRARAPRAPRRRAGDRAARFATVRRPPPPPGPDGRGRGSPLAARRAMTRSTTSSLPRPPPRPCRGAVPRCASNFPAGRRRRRAHPRTRIPHA